MQGKVSVANAEHVFWLKTPEGRVQTALASCDQLEYLTDVSST